MTRRAKAAVLAATLLSLAAAVLPSTLRGDSLPIEAVRELGVGVLFVVAGVLGWTRRPASAVGRLLTVAGLAWLLARDLVWAGHNPVVFTAGLVLVLLPIAFLAHLAVAFPSGRVDSPLRAVDRRQLVPRHRRRGGLPRPVRMCGVSPEPAGGPGRGRFPGLPTNDRPGGHAGDDRSLLQRAGEPLATGNQGGPSHPGAGVAHRPVVCGGVRRQRVVRARRAGGPGPGVGLG